MPVSSVTEHWIKQDALTINLNHFGDPDYLQVSVLAGAVVMAFKQDVIDYNSAHNYRTWLLEAANTYLETSSAVNVYAKMTRSEVNARALIAYDTVLRDIEGREITYAEDGSEILGEPNPDLYYVFLGQISASVDRYGQTIQREWLIDFRFGSLDTNQYQNEEGGGEWKKLFHWNKVTDLIEVLKTFSSAIFKTLSIGEKPITNVKRTVDSDNEFILDENGNAILDEEGNPIKDPEFVPISDETIPTTAWVEKQTDWKFLRKDKDDRSAGKVASDVGFEVGEYIQGLIGGSGAKMYIDEHGKSNLEIDRIYGREELLVPKITFNCTDVITGEMAQTFAYGTIKSIDTERQIATLDLLDDEYGTLHDDDICRGTFHFLDGENSTEYSEDENGFHNYSGYSTSYFTPQEILVNEKGRMEFRYSLQYTGGVHPCVGMNFYAYGNFSDKNRQSITYHTREYTRRLEGVNTWKIQESNIVMQDGNLDGLSIGGKDMSGYSSFQKNLFITGSVIEFTPQQEESLKGDSAYSVNLSNYVGTIRIDDHGNIIDERHTEQDFEYYLRTVIQSKKGTQELFYSSDVGEGAFIASIRPVGCKATLLNGSVFVTEILGGIDHAYIEISVSCEGYANFEFVYEIKLTEDGIGGFDSLVFTRTNGTPSTPVGGSYDNPLPDENASGMEWFDGIPDGTEQVWMSKCHFVSNGLYPEDAKWSKPQPMTDTADFESIYSPREEYLPIPDNFHKNGVDIDASWLALANANHWYDEPEDWNKKGNEFSDRPACWLATNTAKNGVWQGWVVTRILGEKGDSPIRLISSHTTITRNSLGSFEPSKVLLRAVRGEETYHVHLLVFGIDKDGVPHRFDLGDDSYNTKWNYDLRQFEKYEYQSLEFKAYVNGLPSYPTVLEDYNAPSVAEVGLNFVANGIPGAMARNCGKHDINKTYVYNNEYRDYVWAIGSSGAEVYIRTARGIILGNGEGQIPHINVTNTDYWEPAPKTSLTAIDTALIDNASIGGFMFGYTGDVDDQGRPVGVLKSQNEKLILDARTGILRCIDADVDGNIRAGSVAYKVLHAIGETYDLTGYGMVIGFGTFLLPEVKDKYSLEIKILSPSNSRSVIMSELKSVDGTPIRISTENFYGKDVESYEFSNDNTLYSVILVYEYPEADPYWVINSSIGGSEGGGISLYVDSKMDPESENPVQNKVICERFAETEKKINENKIVFTKGIPSKWEQNVLYIIE